MTEKEAVKLAAQMFLTSTDIIIQYKDKENTCIFKMHKLECPQVQISLAMDKEVLNNEVFHIDDAFPLLVQAIMLS